MKKIQKNIAAILIFLGLSVILYIPGLSEGKLVWGQDTSKIVYPFLETLDSSFKNHSLALWSPNIFFGYPIGSEQGQYSPFYLPNIVHAFLPLTSAVNLLSITHLFMAAVFMYYLMRHFKVDAFGSLISGIVFMLNGFIISHLQYPSHIYAYAYLPLEILLIDKGIQKTSKIYFCLAGAILGIQILTGHPNIGVMSAIASVVYLITKTLADKKSRSNYFSILTRIVLLIFPAILVALPYVSQVITLIPLSSRSHGVDFADATNSSFSTYDFITYIFPNFFFGNLSQSWVFANNWHFWTYWGQIETTGYIGIFPILLFIVSITKENIKKYFPIFVVLSVALLLAFGKNTPIYALFYKFPILGSLRAPGKFLYIVDFALAVLSGVGVNTLISKKHLSWKKIAFLVLLPCLLVIIHFLLLSISTNYPNELYRYIQNYYAKLGPIYNLETTDTFKTIFVYAVQNHMPKQIGLVFISSLIIIAINKTKFRIFKLLAISILGFDLLSFAGNVNLWKSPTEMNHYDNPVINSLTKKLTPSSNQRVYTYNSFWSDLMPDQLMPRHIQEASGFVSLIPDRWQQWQADAEKKILTGNEDLFRLGGVKYIYSQSLGVPELKEVSNPLPKAYVSHGWISVSDSETARELTLNGNSTKIPIIESNISDRVLTDNFRAATIVNYDNHYVKVIFDTEQDDSLLVLSDSYYPGWKAFVNGNERVIYQTNYLFRGVIVHPGENTVEFKYEPPFVIPAVTISIGTVIFLTIFKLKKGKILNTEKH